MSCRGPRLQILAIEGIDCAWKRPVHFLAVATNCKSRPTSARRFKLDKVANSLLAHYNPLGYTAYKTKSKTLKIDPWGEAAGIWVSILGMHASTTEKYIYPNWQPIVE